MLRDSGWEIEGPPPGPPVAPAAEAPETAQEVPGDGAPEPDLVFVPGERIVCPHCQRPDVLVNRDGTLRKHSCLIDAAPPDVTFEEEE